MSCLALLAPGWHRIFVHELLERVHRWRLQTLSLTLTIAMRNVPPPTSRTATIPDPFFAIHKRRGGGAERIASWLAT